MQHNGSINGPVGTDDMMQKCIGSVNIITSRAEPATCTLEWAR